MAYISGTSDVSALSCRSPDLHSETQPSLAINMWTQVVQGVTRHELPQRSMKDINMDESLRTGSSPRLMLKDLRCVWGVHRECSQKREA